MVSGNGRIQRKDSFTHTNAVPNLSFYMHVMHELIGSKTALDPADFHSSKCLLFSLAGNDMRASK